MAVHLLQTNFDVGKRRRGRRRSSSHLLHAAVSLSLTDPHLPIGTEPIAVFPYNRIFH